MHVLLRVAIRFSLWAAPVVCGWLAMRPVSAQFSFTPASELPGGGFHGHSLAISGDGSTVVGSIDTENGREAFHWNAQRGLTLLGDIPGGQHFGWAVASSHDGAIVLGNSSYKTVLTAGFSNAGGWQPLLWSADGGMLGLDPDAIARGMSADGSVVVGDTNVGVFRWTATDGLDHVILRSRTHYVGANDVSADGRIIVGWTNNSGRSEAYRWSAEGGLTMLGPGSYASDISADGRVVIGRRGGAANNSRWTEQEGWTPLGHSQIHASGLSADGSVIVGRDTSRVQSGAYFWTPSSGIIDLREFLLANGVANVHDWNLYAGIDVSADGLTIVGSGINPNGEPEAWIATIPEPSTMLLTAIALLVLPLGLLRRGARRPRFVALIAPICSLAFGETAFAQPSFTSLGALPDRRLETYANAVSADGRIVVGYRDAAGAIEAFRWTANDGVVGLGGLRGGSGLSRAFGISADGSTIVGESMWPTPPGTIGWGPQAFSWTADTGMVGLGLLPGSNSTRATAVSANGSVIVGDNSFFSPVRRAFRWTAAEGMIEIARQANGAFSIATDVSADGSVVVGTSDNEAFRWTATRGATFLGPATSAAGISANGSMVLGSTPNGAGYWTEQEGWTELGVPNTSALAAADDCSVVIVGHRGFAPMGTFVWTPALGSLNPRDFLLAHRIDEVQDWTTMHATDVTADGRTIIGHGTNPLGQREAWIATIPEPSTFFLLAAAFVAIAAPRIHSRRVIRHCLVFTIALSAFAAPWPVSAQYSFTPASELPGGGIRGYAAAISGDGSTVVGWTRWTEPQRAWRWNSEGGMVLLGLLRDDDSYSRARGVSFDGSVVVGDSVGRVSPGQTSGLTAEAFRWTAAGGMIGLGLLPGASVSTAEVSSADGSVIAGVSGWYSQYASLKAFRWTAEQGIVELDRPPGHGSTGISGISSDGNVTVGWVNVPSADVQPVRWTAEGRVDLSGSSSIPDGVSADGKVVIGWVNGAARWTEQTGWVSLGDPTANAYAVNGDGSVIVGRYNSLDGALFFWTPTTGIVNLRRHLLDQGLSEVQGWTLEEATDISDDGRTILGYGINPRGEAEAWIATIPEPSTFIIAGAALLIVVAVRIGHGAIMRQKRVLTTRPLARATAPGRKSRRQPPAGRSR